MFTRRLFNSNNIAWSAASANVWALLSAILVLAFFRTARTSVDFATITGNLNCSTTLWGNWRWNAILPVVRRPQKRKATAHALVVKSVSVHRPVDLTCGRGEIWVEFGRPRSIYCWLRPIFDGTILRANLHRLFWITQNIASASSFSWIS